MPNGQTMHGLMVFMGQRGIACAYLIAGRNKSMYKRPVGF